MKSLWDEWDNANLRNNTISLVWNSQKKKLLLEKVSAVVTAQAVLLPKLAPSPSASESQN